MRCSSLRQNSMRCRCLTPLFTWVAVVGRGDEAQRGTVFLSLPQCPWGRGWPSRWSARRKSPLKVFERQAGAGAVLGAQDDEARRSGVCGRLPAGGVRRAQRHHDLLVEVGKPESAQRSPQRVQVVTQ